MWWKAGETSLDTGIVKTGVVQQNRETRQENGTLEGTSSNASERLRGINCVVLTGEKKQTEKGTK